MAVQQNRKSRSKRGMRRAHDALKAPAFSIDSESGETHLRHHITRAVMNVPSTHLLGNASCLDCEGKYIVVNYIVDFF